MLVGFLALQRYVNVFLVDMLQAFTSWPATSSGSGRYLVVDRLMARNQKVKRANFVILRVWSSRYWDVWLASQLNSPEIYSH